jgi:hypothetical protein
MKKQLIKAMMKIISRRKNKTQLVKITDDTFTDAEYKRIISHMNKNVELSPTSLRNDSWPKELIDGVGGYTNTHPVSDPSLVKLLADKCISTIGSSNNYEDYLVMYYEGEGEFALNWHTDRAYSSSASFYLNDNWNDNYGGYFVFRMDGDKLTTAIRPDLGMAVFQKGKIIHAVTATRHDAPKRKSLQVFIR